jgi:transketolase
VYIRINRNDLPVYTSPDGEYQIGKMYPIPGPAGPGPAEAVIFATGAMVWQSMEAAEALYKEGIGIQIINVSTLKPLLKEEVLKYAAGKKAIITAEEANKIGGLGSGIASFIAGEINVPFEQIGMDDQFGTSAHSYGELLEKYGLSSDCIYRTVKSALKK